MKIAVALVLCLIPARHTLAQTESATSHISIESSSRTVTAHDWFRYEIMASNSTLEEFSKPIQDLSFTTKFYLQLPGSLKLADGRVTTDLGIWPDMISSEGSTTSYFFTNDNFVITNTYTPNSDSSFFQFINSILYLDTNAINGASSRSSFFIYGQTPSLSLAFSTQLSSIIGLKFYADRSQPVRFSISTNVKKRLSKQFSIDLLRNEFRYRGEDVLRLRFGPRFNYAFNDAILTRFYIYADPSRDEDIFGAYAGISGEL